MWSDLNHHLHFETDSFSIIVFYQTCITSLSFYCVMKGIVSYLKES